LHRAKTVKIGLKKRPIRLQFGQYFTILFGEQAVGSALKKHPTISVICTEFVEQIFLQLEEK